MQNKRIGNHTLRFADDDKKKVNVGSVKVLNEPLACLTHLMSLRPFVSPLVGTFASGAPPQELFTCGICSQVSGGKPS
jgi:hypothetical protein